jgi:hypothetical protein
MALNTINQSIIFYIFCSNQISDMATIISPMKLHLFQQSTEMIYVYSTIKIPHILLIQNYKI